MKHSRFNNAILALIAITLAAIIPSSLIAEDRVIVVSSADDLAESLDLNAVAEVFKDSTDLQHFEQQLNNPNLYLNNLDINGDGNVDFLRVLEEEAENGRMIIIQAIVAENTFTDIAYIDIQQDDSGGYKLQVRGEEALYGSHSYYVPRYDYVTWPIVLSLWAPHYDRYSSPYYWNYYPSWYSSYSCVRLGFYRSRIAYRYPNNHFSFSFNAGFDNYRHSHHSSHRYYRDYNNHSRNRDYDRGDHSKYGDRKYGTSRKNADKRNTEKRVTRRTDGENHNLNDEKIDRMRRLGNPPKDLNRTQVREGSTDANRTRSVRPSDTRSRTTISSKPTNDRKETILPSKPSPQTRPVTARSSSSTPIKPSERTYVAPKPSQPTRDYTAPKPTESTRSYTPKPSTSRSYSPSEKPRKESPRSTHSRSRDANHRSKDSRPRDR